MDSRPRKLEGKRIIITGASDGIGQQIAIDAAREGARIAFCGLPDDDPSETCNAIRAFGTEPYFEGIDLRQEEPARQFVRNAIDFLGGLDGVVNNAGRNRYCGVANSTVEDLDWVFATNLQPGWVISQEAYPALKANGGGVIVFTSSINAKRSYPGFFPYNMAKAALDALIMSIALEWGKDGIQAVGIAPAMTRTPHAVRHWDTMPDKGASRIEQINSFYPLGRMCETTDVSSLAVFLLCGKCKFISGQSIQLDGGLGAHSGERWQEI